MRVCVERWPVSRPGPPLVPIRRLHGAHSYLIPPILMNIRLFHSLCHSSLSCLLPTVHDNTNPICIYNINDTQSFSAFTLVFSYPQPCVSAMPFHLCTYTNWASSRECPGRQHTSQCHQTGELPSFQFAF